jgi:cysteine synthase
MTERELIPGTTEPKLNEILKSYGVRLVVVHDESNTEHEPEKLIEIARNIALMDLSYEVREIGE